MKCKHDKEMIITYLQDLYVLSTNLTAIFQHLKNKNKSIISIDLKRIYEFYNL